MIIHMWRHWFWITIFSFEALMMLMVKMISFSCIPLQQLTEAGLLINETLMDHNFTSIDTVYSSQNESNLNITFLIHKNNSIANFSQIMSHVSELPEPSRKTNVKWKKNESFQLDSFSKYLFQDFTNISTTQDFGTTEIIHPLPKKSTKPSHMKHVKSKGKEKMSEDYGQEEKKTESANVIEDLNLSENKPDLDKKDVRKSNDGVFEENFSKFSEKSFDLTTVTANKFMSIDLSSPNVTDSKSNLTFPLIDNSSNEVHGKALENDQVLENSKCNHKNGTLIIENKVKGKEPYTTVESFLSENRVAAATSAHNYKSDPSALNAGSITGITLGVLVLFSLFGAVIFVFYRRRYLNKPQVLNDKCSNLDSSGYIDDTSLRENSEEMYSLDNDSFLNSLEAMTIQNYWTENVKHTKL